MATEKRLQGPCDCNETDFCFFKEVLVEIIGFQCLEECLKELKKNSLPKSDALASIPSALPCITKFVVWSNFWAQAWWTNKQCKRTPVWSFSWKFSVVGWSLSANYPVINTFCCFFSLRLLFTKTSFCLTLLEALCALQWSWSWQYLSR